MNVMIGATRSGCGVPEISQLPRSPSRLADLDRVAAELVAEQRLRRAAAGGEADRE